MKEELILKYEAHLNSYRAFRTKEQTKEYYKE